MNEQDKKLNEIRALVEAATPGEWEAWGEYVQILSRDFNRGATTIAEVDKDADRKLIAAAPEALTYTMDIIARQEDYIMQLAELFRYPVSPHAIISLRIDRDRLAAECKTKDALIESLKRDIRRNGL